MGRKGWEKELKSKALWQLSTDILIKALQCKDYKKVPFKDKVHISLSVVNKMLPTNLDIKGEGLSENKIVIINNSRKEEKVERNGSRVKQLSE